MRGDNIKVKTKANTQRTIGIISGILLLFAVIANILDTERLRCLFHIAGFLALAIYLLFILLKKPAPTLISFCLCALYFLIIALSNIADLTLEEKERGLTAGAWALEIGVWSLKYMIEMAFLVQGYWGCLLSNKILRFLILPGGLAKIPWYF